MRTNNRKLFLNDTQFLQEYFYSKFCIYSNFQIQIMLNNQEQQKSNWVPQYKDGTENRQLGAFTKRAPQGQEQDFKRFRPSTRSQDSAYTYQLYKKNKLSGSNHPNKENIGSVISATAHNQKQKQKAAPNHQSTDKMSQKQGKNSGKNDDALGFGSLGQVQKSIKYYVQDKQLLFDRNNLSQHITLKNQESIQNTQMADYNGFEGQQQSRMLKQSNDQPVQPQLHLQAVKKAMHADGRLHSYAEPGICNRSSSSQHQQKQNGRVNSMEDQSTSSHVLSTVLGATLHENIHTEHSIDQRFLSDWQNKVNESSFDTSLKKCYDSGNVNKGINNQSNFQQLYSFDWRTPGCFDSFKSNGAVKIPANNNNQKLLQQPKSHNREQKRAYQQNMMEAYIMMDCGKAEIDGATLSKGNNAPFICKKNSERIKSMDLISSLNYNKLNNLRNRATAADCDPSISNGPRRDIQSIVNNSTHHVIKPTQQHQKCKSPNRFMKSDDSGAAQESTIVFSFQNEIIQQQLQKRKVRQTSIESCGVEMDLMSEKSGELGQNNKQRTQGQGYNTQLKARSVNRAAKAIIEPQSGQLPSTFPLFKPTGQNSNKQVEGRERNQKPLPLNKLGQGMGVEISPSRCYALTSNSIDAGSEVMRLPLHTSATEATAEQKKMTSKNSRVIYEDELKTKFTSGLRTSYVVQTKHFGGNLNNQQVQNPSYIVNNLASTQKEIKVVRDIQSKMSPRNNAGSSLTNREETNNSYLQASKYTGNGLINTQNQIDLSKKSQNSKLDKNRNGQAIPEKLYQSKKTSNNELMKHTFASRGAGGVMTGNLQKKRAQLNANYCTQGTSNTQTAKCSEKTTLDLKTDVYNSATTEVTSLPPSHAPTDPCCPLFIRSIDQSAYQENPSQPASSSFSQPTQAALNPTGAAHFQKPILANKLPSSNNLSEKFGKGGVGNDTIQVEVPKSINFQDLVYQVDGIKEPYSAVVSNAKPMRRPKFFDFGHSQKSQGSGIQVAGVRNTKQSAETSAVHLLKSTHEMNQNRIRKGKTIMNKHSKPVTIQSSLTVNFNRVSSRQIQNVVPQAVKEVQSPVSSCHSSPTKLQKASAEEDKMFVVSQPFALQNVSNDGENTAAVQYPKIVTPIDYNTPMILTAFPNIGSMFLLEQEQSCNPKSGLQKHDSKNGQFSCGAAVSGSSFGKNMRTRSQEKKNSHHQLVFKMTAALTEPVTTAAPPTTTNTKKLNQKDLTVSTRQLFPVKDDHLAPGILGGSTNTSIQGTALGVRGDDKSNKGYNATHKTHFENNQKSQPLTLQNTSQKQLDMHTGKTQLYCNQLVKQVGQKNNSCVDCSDISKCLDPSIDQGGHSGHQQIARVDQTEDTNSQSHIMSTKHPKTYMPLSRQSNLQPTNSNNAFSDQSAPVDCDKNQNSVQPQKKLPNFQKGLNRKQRGCAKDSLQSHIYKLDPVICTDKQSIEVEQSVSDGVKGIQSVGNRIRNVSQLPILNNQKNGEFFQATSKPLNQKQINVAKFQKTSGFHSRATDQTNFDNLPQESIFVKQLQYDLGSSNSRGATQLDKANDNQENKVSQDVQNPECLPSAPKTSTTASTNPVKMGVLTKQQKIKMMQKRNEQKLAEFNEDLAEVAMAAPLPAKTGQFNDSHFSSHKGYGGGGLGGPGSGGVHISTSPHTLCSSKRPKDITYAKKGARLSDSEPLTAAAAFASFHSHSHTQHRPSQVAVQGARTVGQGHGC